MKHSEFKTQIARLVSVYGGGRYPQERLDLMWARFEGIKHEEFKETISKLIGECQYAPMIDVMSAALHSSLIELREQKRANPVDCFRCEGDGRVSLISRDDPFLAPFAFRCVCENGNLYPKYPRTYNGIGSDYYTLSEGIKQRQKLIEERGRD